ncbi:MAG TPA: AsmA family protein [Calditrichaeota bacterium]|nr:AsmA family protein [Calditrichota bacterium]
MFRKLILIIGAVLLLIVIGVIIYVYTFDINRYKSSIEAFASDELGAKVRVDGALSLYLSPLLVLQAESVTIRDQKAVSVFGRTLHIGFNFDSLLSLKIVPQDIIFTGAAAHIRCSESNTCTVTIMAKEISGRLQWPIKNKRLQLTGVNLSDTRVVYLNSASGDTITADSLSLRVDDLQVIIKNPFKFNKIICSSGNFLLPAVDYNGFTLRSLSASYTIKRGKIKLKTRDELPLLGGKTTGEADIYFRKDTVALNLSVSSQNTKAGDLLRLFDQTPVITGRLSAKLDFRTVGTSVKELSAKLNGELKIEAESLRLNGMNIDNLLDNYDKSQNFNIIDIGSVALFGPMGALVTKGADFGALIFTDLGEQTPILRLVSDWVIEDGRARCRDVAFRTPKHIIAMRGVLDFAAFKYDDFAVAVVDEKGCAKIKQTLHGPLGGTAEKPGLIKTILGPFLNLAKTIFKGDCDEFYEGELISKSDG